MGYADLHIHSVYSHDGTSTISAILKYVADRTDLNVIAITDHDSIAGIREGLLLGPKYGIEVIPGCEVSTREGHLLALFINDVVPAGLSLVETVRRVGRMGGVCVAPHPEAKWTSSLTAECMQRALSEPGVANVLVGVETVNGGLVYTRSNLAAMHLAERLDLASVGNSDAHILKMIGQGSTLFEGKTAQDLRGALINHATHARSGQGLGGAQIIQQWFPRFVVRKLGWVDWNADPSAPLRYIRMRKAMMHSAIFQAK